MSTWAGGSSGGPDSMTGARCTWQFCSTFVPQRFYDEGMLLCREHALLVWAIVNEQLAEGPIEDAPAEPELLMRMDSPFAVEPNNRPFPGVVYYIRTGGRIKIGHSTRLAQRLAQYPPDTEVLYLLAGDKQMERAEHRRFNAYLADGREWFQDRPEVTGLIAAMAASNQGWERLLDGDWWRRRKRTEPVVELRHTNNGNGRNNGEFVAG